MFENNEGSKVVCVFFITYNTVCKTVTTNYDMSLVFLDKKPFECMKYDENLKILNIATKNITFKLANIDGKVDALNDMTDISQHENISLQYALNVLFNQE